MYSVMIINKNGDLLQIAGIYLPKRKDILIHMTIIKLNLSLRAEITLIENILQSITDMCLETGQSNLLNLIEKVS